MEQKILIFKIFIIFFFLFYSAAPLTQTVIKGKAKIIDGDTIHIGKNKIRLHGIDAPEIDQTCTIEDRIWNCGLESGLALEKIILDIDIRCLVNDIDKYKRYVAECFINNQNINRYMVRNGWATAYRYYSLDFIQEEKLAQKEKIGIWKGHFQEPYEYRKNKKNK